MKSFRAYVYRDFSTQLGFRVSRDALLIYETPVDRLYRRYFRPRLP
jgi:hypothetical protein